MSLFLVAPAVSSDLTDHRTKEHRSEYRTGSRKNPHWFCKLCGSSLGCDLTWVSREVFGQEERCTINLRMLRDIRPGELTVRKEGYMRDV